MIKKNCKFLHFLKFSRVFIIFGRVIFFAKLIEFLDNFKKKNRKFWKLLEYILDNFEIYFFYLKFSRNNYKNLNFQTLPQTGFSVPFASAKIRSPSMYAPRTNLTPIQGYWNTIFLPPRYVNYFSFIPCHNEN